jgi:hypothetical protein
MYRLVALAVILFVAGWWPWRKAWRDVGGSPSQASTTKVNHGQMLGGLATGIWTGAAFAVALLLLQQWLIVSPADSVWRASVATAAEIPGFTAAGHNLRGIDLSGKRLQDAELKGADLSGARLRDTDLTNADLRDANLHNAVMYSAKLTEANLRGADLSGAQLQGINFKRVQVWSVKTFAGAVANEATCWPHGFLKLAKALGLRAGDLTGHLGTSVGRESPGCL